MGRGGARPGAGRPVDPTSERQERLRAKEAKKAAAGDGSAPAKRSTSSSASRVLGHRFGRLPRAGFSGRVPAWPLSKATARERAVWNEAWRTPQAAAWSTEPWRHRTVALWVRSSVRCEDPDAAASMITATIRLADQIGLTPMGLVANGWEIEEAPGSRALAEAEAPEVPSGKPAGPPPDPAVPIRERLTVVTDGAAG